MLQYAYQLAQKRIAEPKERRTNRAGIRVPGEHEVDGVGGAAFEVGRRVRDRITSYNVCYTKLLRA